jgi:FAD/FMN-containing dehydrogenase/Fe-S oxidoreductase
MTPPNGSARPASSVAERLEHELRRRIDGEVRFGPGDRALYSTDSSSYRQVPIGVVIPRCIDDVVETVAVCREFGAPVLSRGGGTSLAGQCCNVAVVIDHSKYLNRVLDLDRERRLARVEPGVVLDSLRDVGRAGAPRLTFGPTPSTHDRCTIGGMIGNNSCGNYSIMSEFYGPGPRMQHNVEEMDVLLYDGTRVRVTRGMSEDELDRTIRGGGRTGEIHERLRELRDRYEEEIRARFHEFPRRVSGYNLDALLPENGFDVVQALVGTESTCVTVLEATLRMIDEPAHRAIAVVGFEDLYAAAAQVVAAREHRPIALEGFDDVLIEDNARLGKHLEELRRLPAGAGWLMAEFPGGSAEEAASQARALVEELRGSEGFRDGRVYDDPASQARIWEVRESGLGATAYVPGDPDTYSGWEDAAVPPEHLSAYLRRFRALLDSYGYTGALYGHWGQGCVHTRIDWDPHTVDGVERWRRFVDDAADLVLSYGGSLSGEHGDGQSRAALLPKMFGDRIVQAFRGFKEIWDPDGKMNPGKVVDPYPVTSKLRLGPDFAPSQVRSTFSYPREGGSFAHAAVRCVGVGACRRLGSESGVMCPSFQVTREEKHSTRGRAHLLFEMIRGEAGLGMWRSKEVADALHLCLACKGCKSDCPVNVDMATYKAEFLSHRYRRRMRPRQAYAMGLIMWWARIASRVPRTVNLVAHAPIVSPLLKRAAGVATDRDAPRFATETLRAWFDRRPAVNRGRPEVMVWPDTFTNFLTPGPGRATVEVLEDAGFRVVFPPRILCCGRPLYDYGMLDLARAMLRKVLTTLRPWIRAGIPLVGVEPSCLAVFRDELVNLFPHDQDARRLAAQSFVLSEFLDRYAPDWEPPRIERRAIVQPHCHHHAVMGFDDELDLIRRMGLDPAPIDTGCCGMAGSFGFEAGDRYEVSRACGERVLLPRVRAADASTLVLADGFSCRTQVEQGTGRRPLHLAEAIRLAGRTRPTGGPRPEVVAATRGARDG